MDKPIEYEQYSTRWKNISYTITGNSRQTIGTSGCGPSSAAMVIATLRDKKITPKETCKYATEKGYRTINSGTAHAFFPSIMKKYDIPCYKTYDFAKVMSALKKNYMVIAAAGIGIWTRGGHIILAYGIKDNKVLINDPNSEAGHRELANQSNFKNECSPFWVIEEEWREEDMPEIKTIIVKHQSLGDVKLQTVNINGENFARLRDMEKIAPIDIGWDGKNPTVKMNYKK